MPNRTGLLTGWLTIGTSGPTVDGRNIKPQWLTDAAELYDPAEYTAVANAEHWFGNYGSVRELRTIKDSKERIALQARLRPNQHYLAQNADDHRLFFSMELTHNFAETKKTYLTGLATTDNPASLGTSETHFKQKDNEQTFRGGSEEFSAGALQVVEDQKTELIPALKAALKDFFSNHKHKTPKQEEFEMTEEQVKEMLDGQKAINESLTTLLGKFTPETPAPVVPETPAAVVPETPETNDFATLTAAVGKLNESVESLSTDFKKAAEGKFGKQAPASEGSEVDGEFL